MEESGDEDDVPEGAVRFELEAAGIEAALAEQGIEVEAREDVDVRTGRGWREASRCCGVCSCPCASCSAGRGGEAGPGD